MLIKNSRLFYANGIKRLVMKSIVPLLLMKSQLAKEQGE